MRCLVQRVHHASVEVDTIQRAAIGPGLLILTGIEPEDDDTVLRAMCRKVAHLRIFSDEEGRFQHSLLDVGGAALVVSQFTLSADLRRGRRPSFSGAAPGDFAEPMIDQFVEALRQEGIQTVEQGVFGADMNVHLCNKRSRHHLVGQRSILQNVTPRATMETSTFSRQYR